VSIRATQSPTRVGGTLGTGRDVRRRILLHHVPLALASAGALVVLIGLAPAHGSFSIQRVASPTGDVALVFLAVTLLIGPANLLLRRRNPVNSYLRRDVGTWTAIWSVVHVVVGFQGHGGGAFGFAHYFVADGRPLTNSFGMGNWTGLAATVIVVLLLVLSNDRYLRELKSRRWKGLQRLNYTLFGLVVLHAVYYGALSRMTSTFTRLLIVSVIAVLAGQAVGVWLWRRTNARPAHEVGSGKRQSAGALQ
jgi:methionine sulfoxide reductase heme-binding subunit